MPRKGTAPEVHRRVAARQGEVRQEAGTGTRRRADGRRGGETRGGRGGPRRARDVLRRQAAVERSCSPARPLPPDDAAGRRTTIKAVLDELGKDHGKPETLVERRARRRWTRSRRSSARRRSSRCPDPDACKIIEMPEFQRGFSAAYLNPAPPLDPKADSLYAVAPPPKDWPPARQATFFREYNPAMLQILTIHEAYPGHYVQLEYSNRYPSLVRKVLSSGVVRRGVGGVHRADDARPGLRRRRPVAAAAPTEVLPPGGAERDPRPQDALPRT